MKTNLLQSNKLNKFFSLRIIALLACVFVYTAVEAGNKGTKSDVKSLKVRLERAEDSYQKNLQKKLLADSLLNVGAALHETSAEEMRSAFLHTNNKAKDFTRQMKKLEKGLKSKSMAEVSQVKLAIRALEEDYKQALSSFDITMKDQIKIADEGTATKTRGYAFKREVTKSLRYSAKNLKRAQMAIEEQGLLTSN
jgi:hypothetical protein